jgi:prepilin-type processing-associated H-X9-DG protein
MLAYCRLAASAGWKVYRRDVDISSRTFVFVDEHPQSMNDGGFAVRGVNPTMPATWGIVDFPAVYHNKASSFNFGDGHAEIKRWQDGRTTRLIDYSGPQITGGFTNQPNNPDSLWLSQAATE